MLMQEKDSRFGWTIEIFYRFETDFAASVDKY